MDDTYNASHELVKVAPNYLCKYKGRRKIAVLADILKLGSKSKKRAKNLFKTF